MTDKQVDPIEHLLTEGLVSPPEHFTQTVLREISLQVPTQRQQRSTTGTAAIRLCRAAALAAGTTLGVIQLISFIFGIWIPATAG